MPKARTVCDHGGEHRVVGPAGGEGGEEPVAESSSAPPGAASAGTSPRSSTMSSAWRQKPYSAQTWGRFAAGRA